MSTEFSSNASVRNFNDKFALFPTLFNIRSVARDHIDSFDNFLNHKIQEIIYSSPNNKVTCDYDQDFYLKYTAIHVGRPGFEDHDSFNAGITPHECRIRNMTYGAPIWVDVVYTVGKNTVINKRKNNRGGVNIGHLPMMLRSRRCTLRGCSDEELSKLGECPLDPGGYFVIQGTEKVILIQEKFTTNCIFVSLDTNKMPIVSVSSSYESMTKVIVLYKRGCIFAKMNIYNEDIPVIIIIKALGIESEQDIMQLVTKDSRLSEILVPSLLDCDNNGVFSSYQALNWLSKKRRLSRYPKDTSNTTTLKSKDMQSLLFDALPTSAPTSQCSKRDKALYLALMIKKVLIATLDPEKFDDIHYCGNRRFELSGDLLASLFEDLFKRMNTDLKRLVHLQLSKRNKSSPFDVVKYIRSTIISDGVDAAFLSGNWTLKHFHSQLSGVTQDLSRLSFISTLGMMNRINTQYQKTRKVFGPRALNSSQWGILCPCDTPEGDNCGIVKNLAIFSRFTMEVKDASIMSISFSMGVQAMYKFTIWELHKKGTALVLFNGLIIGIHTSPMHFISKMRLLRREGRLVRFVSISYADLCINVYSDSGRPCRPLILCYDGVPRMTKAHLFALKLGEITLDELIAEGVLEYLDVNEENNSFIALFESECNKDTTHLEIDPLTVLGIVAGLIPYPHHNQSPRNTYQCAMGKQAMGNIAFNQLQRLDSQLFLLCYTQMPLLTTLTAKLISFEKLGAGINAVVAVMSFSGYDIEDSIQINKASIDRGFGRCMVMRSFSTSIKKYAERSNDIIVSPTSRYSPTTKKNTKNVISSFANLDVDGLACPGSLLRAGDIYINKYTSTTYQNSAIFNSALPDSSFHPSPMIWKCQKTDRCVVDNVVITTNEFNHMVVRLLIRHTREPELGDKFSSRHGQKGVVGNIVNTEDMPFSEQGISPDLIMNPHGFPSRLTVGKMIELIGSKAASLSGNHIYGSAFGEPAGMASSVNIIGNCLAENGFSYNGKDFLTSGVTGEPLEAYIFIGNVYYQKLKHMVSEKLHSRARGPKVLLTRQPTEGRSRDGGLRFGEMERDCLISYGSATLLLERLMISSDLTVVYICTRCKVMGYWNNETRSGSCSLCGQCNNLERIYLPYACKLLFQELQSMNITSKLKISD